MEWEAEFLVEGIKQVGTLVEIQDRSNGDELDVIYEDGRPIFYYTDSSYMWDEIARLPFFGNSRYHGIVLAWPQFPLEELHQVGSGRIVQIAVPVPRGLEVIVVERWSTGRGFTEMVMLWEPHRPLWSSLTITTHHGDRSEGELEVEAKVSRWGH